MLAGHLFEHAASLISLQTQSIQKGYLIHSTHSSESAYDLLIRGTHLVGVNVVARGGADLLLNGIEAYSDR